jgi:phosphatidylserine decarboxylase
MSNTPAATGSRTSLAGRAFVTFQYLLPQHALSRLILHATRVRAPWFKNALIKGFLKLFEVDMSDAQTVEPLRFASFNEFFTRPLKPTARPIAGDADLIVSPVDGTVSECGAIDQNRLLQAKGRTFTLQDLLADQPWASTFAGGSFCTIYLAPYNYHRIHIPAAGDLLSTVYVPGALFSVNATTAQHVPRLFARNERVLTLFETAFGKMAVVLVGALNVGSMATVWAGDITPAARRRVTVLPSTPITLAKADELGRFNMGSTVIVLFEASRARLLPQIRAGLRIKVGEPLAQVERGAT